MSDQQPEITPQPDPTPAIPPADPVETAPPKSNTGWIKIAVGVFLVIGIIMCGVTVCAMGSLPGFFSSMSQSKEGMDEPIDAFMVAMEDKDTDAAYALFSTQARKSFKQTELDALLEGNNYVLFEGYRSVSVVSVNIRAALNTNPDLPQGTIATTSGTVTYEDDITGTFEATLQQEDGEWKLMNINVVAPPEKFPGGSD